MWAEGLERPGSWSWGEGWAVCFPKSAAGASASSTAWPVQGSQESHTHRLGLWGGWGKEQGERSRETGTEKARAREPAEQTATKSASEVEKNTNSRQRRREGKTHEERVKGKKWKQKSETAEDEGRASSRAPGAAPAPPGADAALTLGCAAPILARARPRRQGCLPGPPPERPPPPTTRLCASWAPNRIQVAGPPVRRRARRRKPERRRQRHGILQKLPPARRGLRGVLRRPDSPSARCAPPSPSSHAPPARPVARDGVRGPQLPLSRSPPRPPAGAGRKVAPKSWYLR